MTSNIQQSPYLREQRQFPYENIKDLANQVDHAYIDIASKVNARELGTYALGVQIVNGKRYFFSGSNQSQQGLRQVYLFDSFAPIPHGITYSTISQLPTGYGGFTDGTNMYGLLFATNITVPGLVTFYVDPTNIIFLVGAGAPAITSGMLVLEWVSQV